MTTPNWQQLLTEAYTALHKLQTGTQVVRVRTAAGQDVEYNRANVTDLKNHIAELTALAAGRPTRGAIFPIFGR